MLNEKKMSPCSMCGGIPILRDRIYTLSENPIELGSIFGVVCSKCKRRTRRYRTGEHKNAADLAVRNWNKVQEELKDKANPPKEEPPMSCPFCGGVAILQENDLLNRFVYVECTSCKIRTSEHLRAGWAIEKWNTRCKGAEQEDGVEKV